jgi:hypothetical protein
MGYAAVRIIVRRPRSGDVGDVAVDDRLRERAAGVVTGAVGVLVALPLAGVSLTAAGGLLSPSCAPAWWTIMGWSLLALAAAALALLSWCAAAILTPMSRAETPARPR